MRCTWFNLDSSQPHESAYDPAAPCFKGKWTRIAHRKALRMPQQNKKNPYRTSNVMMIQKVTGFSSRSTQERRPITEPPRTP
jgi:hypothetical protein